MRAYLYRFAVLLCFSASLRAAESWGIAQSAHFELAFEQEEASRVGSAINWFERLHAGLVFCEGEHQALRIRVVAFSSKTEFDRYRSGETADAFFLGSHSRNYIVLAGLEHGPSSRVEAHEYVHVAFRLCGREFPLWLSEGLAELYSTARESGAGLTVGGDIPEHREVLRRRGLLPLTELLSGTRTELASDRRFANSFYPSTWALVSMLMLHPAYAPHTSELFSALEHGTAFPRAVADVTGKTQDVVTKDLRHWLRQAPPPLTLSGASGTSSRFEVQPMPPRDADLLLADLLYVSGTIERAAAAYETIERGTSPCAECEQVLGEIALKRNDLSGARDHWTRALELGLQDPVLCFRLASLADSLDVPRDIVRSTLRRAITLRPDFDDARYKLGLLESSDGDFEQAVQQLQAMHVVPPQRAFAYWSALAYALDEAGRHDEAGTAALRARVYAVDAAERAQADRLAFFARTELHVQMVEDANGRATMVTTRVPRGIEKPSPFIQPGDRIQSVEGQLQTIECSGGKASGLLVSRSEGQMDLAIPNPDWVQIEDGPQQFACGEQPSPRSVKILYALPRSGEKGTVRVIQFK